MNDATTIAVNGLRNDYLCSYVRVTLQRADGTSEIVGESGEAENVNVERFAFPIGDRVRSLAFEVVFSSRATDADRAEAKIFAQSATQSYESVDAIERAFDTEQGCILIVDDDAATRLLVRRVLERAGYRVIEAANGLLGITEALRSLPDLIIMDWMMPVMDGRDATRQLKNEPDVQNIPVLMLTSRARPSDRLAALDAGVQDFLNKPFEPSALVEGVKQQLRWRKLLSGDVGDVAEGGVLANDAPPAAAGPSLEMLISRAEHGEERLAFDDAARAYAAASETAGHLANPELANKLMRLSGKMQLLLAERATDPSVIARAYSSAARAFMTAGNLTLAKEAHAAAKEADGQR